MSLKKTFRLSHLALTTLLLLPSLLTAESEPRWYQVEIIIFSQNNPSYHTSEHWPQDYTLPDVEKSRNLVWPRNNNGAKLQPFTLQANNDFKLGAAAKRIQAADDVKLVLHLGWLQPGLEQNDTVAVHIYEGMLNDSPQSLMNGTLPKLDGTLRLTLARYLHLESDLLWREPLAENSPHHDKVDGPATMGNSESTAVDGVSPAEVSAEREGEKYQVYRLQQSRRMRSSEIHYIDHPMFGIIALVTPYERAITEKK